MEIRGTFVVIRVKIRIFAPDFQSKSELLLPIFKLKSYKKLILCLLI